MLTSSAETFSDNAIFNFVLFIRLHFRNLAKEQSKWSE